MKNLIKSLLYTLVSQALMVFDESSFGDSQVVGLIFISFLNFDDIHTDSLIFMFCF